MRPLRILILSDGRPGHYHLAEGIAAAISRRRTVSIEKLELSRRRAIPGRLLAILLARKASPSLVLAAGYGWHLPALTDFDLVISAGGETLAANVAAARILRAPNVFCGTLRHLPETAFSLIVSSYARHATRSRHLVALKPSGIDPDTLAAANRERRKSGWPPKTAGLLVGGESGLFHYTDREWQKLLDFISQSHQTAGINWHVSTSRRSPAAVADRLARLAATVGGPIAEFIDFRTAGPGTLPRLFSAVEAVLCTEDSSTMISEAVCARLPVVGVSPTRHGFKDEEREYRAFMAEQGWCRYLALADLDTARFLAALEHITPLGENHLDRLADQLAERLPQLALAPASR